MRKILIVTSLFILLVTKAIYAQEKCGHLDYLEYLELQEPGIKANVKQTFFDALSLSKLKTKKQQDTVYKINVVFHIVYNNNRQNIDDSLVYSQLRVLNEAFRRTTPDTVKTRDIFKPVAADAGIEFVLATEDPEGNPTDGIVRAQSVRTTFGSFPTSLETADLVKNSSVGSKAWDTDKYLNIWVCDLSYNGFDGLYGFAYPPTNSANWPGGGSFTTADKQGVVCHFKVVGVGNPENAANEDNTGSKTMVHEVGHYLGLRHIWGDTRCGNDYMDDTPSARRASTGCNIGVNTCIEAGEQFPDMLENYMDYSSDACQNVFTNDQVAQMRLNLRLFRSEIYTEEVAEEPEPDIEWFTEATGVFPNPLLNADLNVYLHEVDENATYSLQLFNLLGQLIAAIELDAVSKQQVVISGGLQGAYIYRINKGNEELVSSKLLVSQ
ncbi:M43 family zinc metalloprotease [Bacteroidia bacterium]|nr:M43 family zinc metalloprotease [Bacteroidia bacterium]